MLMNTNKVGVAHYIARFSGAKTGAITFIANKCYKHTIKSKFFILSHTCNHRHLRNYTTHRYIHTLKCLKTRSSSCPVQTAKPHLPTEEDRPDSLPATRSGRQQAEGLHRCLPAATELDHEEEQPCPNCLATRQQRPTPTFSKPKVKDGRRSRGKNPFFHLTASQAVLDRFPMLYC